MELDLRGTRLEKVLLIGFFLSGFAALTYEIIWIQILTLVYGGSTYSYSLLLGAFLSGLGIGSFFFGRLSSRIKDPVIALGWIELGVAMSSLLVLPLFEHLDVFYLRLMKIELHPLLLPVGWIGLTSFLLIPTSLMGAKFPIAARFYSTSQKTRGRDIGILYSVNTLGAVFSGWWTGFVLLPKIGLEHTYILATLIDFSVAALIFWFAMTIQWTMKGTLKIAIYSLSIIFVLTAFTISGEEIDTRFAGVYYIGPEMEINEWINLKRTSNITFNKFSPYGLVTVGKDAGVKYISVDGKPEASDGPFDLDGQYLLGYIPMFAHDNPRRVLHIGAGAGFTLDAIRNFEVEHIHAVEINPVVLEAAKKYFTMETNNVFSDPRIRLIVGDGRHHLSVGNEKYDVIIMTPSNPWVSGSSFLFTTEFYEIAKRSLNEGGIFTAWAPMYEYDFEAISVYLNTINTVFPEINVFIAGGDMIMLASMDPIEINYSRLLEKTKDDSVSRHFSKIGSYYGVPVRNEEKIPLTFRLNTQDFNVFIENTEVSTDDKPILEFRAAKKAILNPIGKEIFADTIHKIHMFKTTYTPPLSEVIEKNEYGSDFKHMGLRIREGDGWILDTWTYSFNFIPAPNLVTYSTDKFLRYILPNKGVLYVLQEDVFSEPKKEEIELYLLDTLVPDSLVYRGNMDLNTDERERIFVHELSLGGGSLKGMSYTWYCKRNEALYIAAVAYPVNADVDFEEPLSRLECIH